MQFEPVKLKCSETSKKIAEICLICIKSKWPYRGQILKFVVPGKMWVDLSWSYIVQSTVPCSIPLYHTENQKKYKVWPMTDQRRCKDLLTYSHDDFWTISKGQMPIPMVYYVSLYEDHLKLVRFFEFKMIPRFLF